jgi:hypothetical protein
LWVDHRAFLAGRLKIDHHNEWTEPQRHARACVICSVGRAFRFATVNTPSFTVPLSHSITIRV